jgi:hypothetical protein
MNLEGKGGGWVRKSDDLNMIRAHYVHVWKYHNETLHFVQLKKFRPGSHL